MQTPSSTGPNSLRLHKFTRNIFFAWGVLTAALRLPDIKMENYEHSSILVVIIYLIGIPWTIFTISNMDDDDPWLEYNYKMVVMMSTLLLTEFFFYIDQPYLGTSASMMLMVTFIYFIVACIKSVLKQHTSEKS